MDTHTTIHVVCFHYVCVGDDGGRITHLAFEDALGVLLGQGQETTSDGTDLGQGVLHTPDLSLILQTIFTNDLELLVEPFLLERTAGNR